MDVARYRSAAPVRVRVRGFDRHVPIRPLTRAELFSVDDVVGSRFGEHRHPARDIETQIVTVGLATGIPASALTVAQLRDLFDAWERVQDDHMPPTEQLGAEVELQLLEDHGSLIGDAIAAAQSTSPGDFFGSATGSLTDGQLAYYLTIRNAHENQFGEGTKCTMATLRNRAKRSAT